MTGKLGIPMKIYGTHNAKVPLFFASFKKVLKLSKARLSLVAKTLPLNIPSLKKMRTDKIINPI